MAQLEFYYDFSCPYAYLASTQIERVAERAGAELVYRPFLLGGVFNALGPAAPDMARMPPPRARLNGLDMHRWAEHWQVPLRMPPTHPNRTVTALRAALASADLPRASHALFRAYWAEGLDLSDPEVVRVTLDAAGLDGTRLVERAGDAAIKSELRARTDEALSRGVFGAPACFVDGELYWGQDRLDQVARALGLGHDEAHALTLGTPPAPGAGRGRSFEFWYDFSSPFAYLASTQVEALAERSGADLVWRPFLLGALFHDIGTPDVPLLSFSGSKQRFLRSDMERFARAYGVPFRFPSRFPMRTVTALRMALAAGDDLRALSHALFRAYWADDRDISDPDELRAIAEGAGLEPALVDRAAEYKQPLFAATAQANARGLCGAPSFVVQDLVFWGQDRMTFVEHALAGWRPRVG